MKCLKCGIDPNKVTGGRCGCEETLWFLPDDYEEGEDESPRYIVSEIELRKLFCMKFAPLDHNRDFVMEFIEEEKLKEVKEDD